MVKVSSNKSLRVFRASQQALLLVVAALIAQTVGCLARWPASDRVSGPCAAGQIKVCTNRCANLEMGVGELCNVDICAPNSPNFPVVCAAGLSCVPIDPVEDPLRGTCQRRNVLPCDPTVPRGQAGNQCPDSLVCVPLGTRAEVQFGLACGPSFSLNGQGPFGGVCVPPRLDGEACDSTVRQLVPGNTRDRQALCAPCADPLLCWDGVCRRSCDADPQRPGRLGNANLCQVNANPAVAQFNCTRNAAQQNVPQGQTAPTALLCTKCIAQLGAACATDDSARAGFDPELNSSPIRTVATSPRNVPVIGNVVTDVTGFCPGFTTVGGLSICAPGTSGPDDFFAERDSCCGTAACVNGECCQPPGQTCTSDAQCCSARVLNGDGTPSNRYVRTPCCTPAMAILGCTPGTCFSQPVNSQCANDATCGAGFVCRNSQCVPCGAAGSPCCINPGTLDCVGANVCTAGRICAPCGGPFQQCCRGAAPCNSNTLACTGPAPGLCTPAQPPCGGFGQPCCRNQPACGAGAVCSPASNTCVACGTPGAPCCPNRRCVVNNFACMGAGNDATCQPTCGALNQVCCADGSCTTAATRCQPGLGDRRCLPCGGANQLCCTDGTPACSTAGQQCFANDRCQSCGQNLQQCCPGATCAAGNQCINGQCLSCGQQGAMCCPGNRCNGQLDPRLVCTNNTCVAAPPCGGRDQSCCDPDVANPCNQFLTCENNFCRCGDRGQVCCNGTTCRPFDVDSNPLFCRNGTCAI